MTWRRNIARVVGTGAFLLLAGCASVERTPASPEVTGAVPAPGGARVLAPVLPALPPAVILLPSAGPAPAARTLEQPAEAPPVPEDFVPAQPPPALKFVVREGDTLGQIAECFEVTTMQLRKTNGIRGQLLAVGQELRLPANANPACTDPVRTYAAACLPAVSAARLAKVAPHCIHVVHRGENLSYVASESGRDAGYLAELNGMTCDVIHPGQRLLTCEDLRVTNPSVPKGPRPVALRPQPKQVVADPPRPPQPCQTRLLPHKNPNRTVLFADGELPGLFRRYRTLLKEAGVDANWQQLKVVYFDAAGTKAVVVGKPLTIGPMFAGATPLSELNGRLKGLSAAARTSSADDANALGADLVCGP